MTAPKDPITGRRAGETWAQHQARLRAAARTMGRRRQIERERAEADAVPSFDEFEREERRRGRR